MILTGMGNDGAAGVASIRRKSGYSIVQNEASSVVWGMPNINGYEFLEKVKQDKRYRNIPVVMLTTVSQKEKMIEAIRAGAKQYITKPFTSETLLTKIIQALGLDSLEEL